MVLSIKYESINIVPSSAKLHWNKPTALRLAFITKGTYLRPKKELFLLLKKSNLTLKQKK